MKKWSSAARTRGLVGCTTRKTVGMAGIEPTFSCSPNKRFCQAKLHPEKPRLPSGATTKVARSHTHDEEVAPLGRGTRDVDPRRGHRQRLRSTRGLQRKHARLIGRTVPLLLVARTTRSHDVGPLRTTTRR